jgi:lipoate-protein ligase A
VTRRFEGRPDLDTAISRAILDRVASGELPETLRLFVADRMVAFGRQDVANPEYAAAVEAARSAGFAPIERLAGGKAAVFHEATLAFSWAIPEPRPRETIHQRFEAIASIVVEALISLGVDAHIGEVPGEYCPGTFSVNAGGRAKIMGVGQRLIAGAAHVGGVVVVDRTDLINRVLTPVYDALGYEWNPEATGAVTDEATVVWAEGALGGADRAANR